MIVVLAGVLLGVGLIVLGQLSTQAGHETTTEENITVDNDTDTALTFQEIISFDTVANASDYTQVIPSVCYTTHSNGTFRYIMFDLNGTHQNCNVTNAADVYVKYIYNEYNIPAYTAQNDTVSSIGSFSGWFSIIVIVVIASIILGILIRNLFGGRRVV